MSPHSGDYEEAIEQIIPFRCLVWIKSQVGIIEYEWDDCGEYHTSVENQ